MASKGLSSNPALAAIQRAKQEAEKSRSAANNSNNVRASSLDMARSTSLSSHASLGVPASVGSPPASWTPRTPSGTTPPSFNSNTNKHLDEDERSMLREGWWAKTDAGSMNVEEVKRKEGGSSYVASAALGLAKKLDFASMLKDATPDEAPVAAAPPAAAVEAPPPAVSAPAKARASDAAGAAEAGRGGVGSSAVDLKATPPAATTAPGAGGDGDDKSWWKKMDNKDLNEADVPEAKGAKTAFTPQFVGNSGLTSKLDFTGSA